MMAFIRQTTMRTTQRQHSMRSLGCRASVFFNQMNPDSVVIFDAFSGTVQDITPGRENTGVFYLGENVADVIVGRNGNDHMEGFAGSDVLGGGGGNDYIDGGGNVDTIVFSGVSTEYTITDTGDLISVADTIANRDGTDILTNVDVLQFTDQVNRSERRNGGRNTK